MSKTIIRKNRSKKKINYDRHVIIVARSNKNVNVQLLEPITKKTLVTFDSYKVKGSKTDKSKFVGDSMAKYLEKNKISNIVFDRNGYLFHGRIKAVADAILKSK
jgi:large subunit ribosomal protein L18